MQHDPRHSHAPATSPASGQPDGWIPAAVDGAASAARTAPAEDARAEGNGAADAPGGDTLPGGNPAYGNVVISLGREYGSGGREIGERLSERLGYAYYDKVLLKRLAEKSGLADEAIESFDEKPFSRLLLSPNRFLSGSDGHPLAQIHAAEIDLIHSLAQEGPCVIVGRCVDSVLAGYPHLVRLFVSAPMEDRVARVMRRNSLDEEQARARIARTDKERASYYRYFTDQKWGLASNYDLCVNSAMAGIEGTVEVIAQFLERRQAAR